MKKAFLAIALMVSSLGAMHRNAMPEPTSCNCWNLSSGLQGNAHNDQRDDQEFFRNMQALGIPISDFTLNLCGCGHKANNSAAHFFINLRARVASVKQVLERYNLIGDNVLLLQLELAELAPFFIDKCGAINCVGIDNRRDVVALMNRNYSRGNISFNCQNINEIQYSNDFDFILLPFCIQQVNTKRLLHRLFSALKVGGKLAILVAKHTPDRTVNQWVGSLLKHSFLYSLYVCPYKMSYQLQNDDEGDPFEFFLIEITKLQISADEIIEGIVKMKLSPSSQSCGQEAGSMV